MNKKLLPQNDRLATNRSSVLAQSAPSLDPNIRAQLSNHLGRTIEGDPNFIINIIGNGIASKSFQKVHNSVTMSLSELTRNTWILTNSKRSVKVSTGSDVDEIGFHSNNDLKKEVFEGFEMDKKLKCSLVIGGTNDNLEEVVNNLEANNPLILIENSGGLVDLIVHLIRTIETPDDDSIISALEMIPSNQSLSVDRNLLKKCLLKSTLFTITDAAFTGIENVPDALLESLLERTKEDENYGGTTNLTAERRKRRKRLVSLSVELDCPITFSRIIKEFDLEEQATLDLLKKLLLMSTMDSNTNLIKILDIHFNQLISPKVQTENLRDLYEKDKVMLKEVKKFIKNEKVAIRGLDVLANQLDVILKSSENNDSNNSVPSRGFHLFIWALFHEHYELAKYIWTISKHPIANGITATTLLRSLKTSKYKEDGVYTEDEGNTRKENQACWYENNAINLLTECFKRDPIRTKFLLVQHMKESGASCLELAVMDEDNAKFLAHPVCERHLDDIWMTCLNSNRKNDLFFVIFSLLIFAYVPLAVAGIINEELFDSTKFWIYLVAGFSISLLAVFSAYHLQKRPKFQSMFGIEYEEIRPQRGEDESEDKEHLKNLGEKGMMQCLRVGIDTRGMFPQMDIYSPWWRIWSSRHPYRVFENIPYFKFIAHVTFYFCFLVILLRQISKIGAEFSGKPPGALEILVFVFWGSLFMVELRQLLRSLKNEDGIKTKPYLSYSWNRFDVFLFFYFLVLVTLRITFYSQCSGNNTETEKVCHVMSLGLLHIYAFYFVLWVLRFIQFFAVSRFLGPKVIMLKMMVGDLLRIIIFIVLASCGFGFWMHWIINSTNKGFYTPEDGNDYTDRGVNSTNGEDFNKTQIVFYVDTVLGDPFWNLFGDGLRDFKMSKTCTTDENCEFYFHFMKQLMIPLFRFIYMLLAGVLLLNLLIAIFSERITHVTARSNQIWNIYRKDVLLEFYYRQQFPIPISLLTSAISIFVQLFHILSSNHCRRRPQSMLFKTAPLKMILIENECDNSKITENTNNPIPNNDLNEKGNRDNENYMKTWFEFVTNWEKEIHNEIEKNKSRKKYNPL